MKIRQAGAEKICLPGRAGLRCDQNVNTMTLPAYPVASGAQDALHKLKVAATPRAAREREAETLAGARVIFVTESTGPLYEQEADAMSAWAGVAGDVACRLVCRLKDAPRKSRKPLEPTFRDGERWPQLKAPPVAVWQLSISYWKVLDMARTSPGTSPSKPARALRRKGGEALTPEEVLALVESPMTAGRPQKALDFGLFDFPLPENPGIIIADE